MNIKQAQDQLFQRLDKHQRLAFLQMVIADVIPQGLGK